MCWSCHVGGDNISFRNFEWTCVVPSHSSVAAILNRCFGNCVYIFLQYLIRFYVFFSLAAQHWCILQQFLHCFFFPLQALCLLLRACLTSMLTYYGLIMVARLFGMRLRLSSLILFLKIPNPNAALFVTFTWQLRKGFSMCSAALYLCWSSINICKNIYF